MKKTILLALSSASAIALTQSLHADPLTWSGNGHAYEYVQGLGLSWEEARDAAIARGGHLVTLTSSDEEAFVLSNVIGQLQPVGEKGLTYNSAVWGGASQSLTAQSSISDWSWVTGEAWDYTNWRFNEPNDYFGLNSENFLTINWKDFNSTWGNYDDVSRQWNDARLKTNDVQGYVVEYSREVNNVPDSASTVALLGLGLMGLAAFRRRA
jgi:hypothetical protein